MLKLQTNFPPGRNFSIVKISFPLHSRTPKTNKSLWASHFIENSKFQCTLMVTAIWFDLKECLFTRTIWFSLIWKQIGGWRFDLICFEILFWWIWFDLLWHNGLVIAIWCNLNWKNVLLTLIWFDLENVYVPGRFDLVWFENILVVKDLIWVDLTKCLNKFDLNWFERSYFNILIWFDL